MAAGDRWLGDMTRPEHAYALGVIAAVGRVREGALELRLRGDGAPLLGLLPAKTSSDIPVPHEVRGERVRVSAPLADCAKEHLGASPGETEQLLFPRFESELGWAFVRGLFDATGQIAPPERDELVIKLDRPGERLLQGLLAFVGVAPSHLGKKRIRWTGVAALDLLGKLYEGVRRSASLESSAASALYRVEHLSAYEAWCRRVLLFASDEAKSAPLRVQLVHPNAVVPSKERVSDSGYDLCLLYEKSRYGNVSLYGTGIIIEPPQGWYFDVVARSSIIKRGYMLANNVGIIDRAYRGEILVPLLKTDPSAPDLELPARIAQLIPRPIVHFPVEVTGELSGTQRGAGGFGSTGK